MNHSYAESACASNSQTAMQYGMASAQVSALNRHPEPALSDLIDRMAGANKQTIARAEMAEQLADLLCGEVPTGCGEANAPRSPGALLSRLENEIDAANSISSRIDAALHRIARRLSSDRP
jgi:hypothetical protein